MLRKIFVSNDGIFSEPVRSALQTVFDLSNSSKNDKANNDYLNERLRSILQSANFYEWYISPSGMNHIVVSSCDIILINIYGFINICGSVIYQEGEGGIANGVHWLEQDHLASFYHYYIVQNKLNRIVCHYSKPLFISCKTNEIQTEALNELAIIRDRFGGKGSRAMIVTSANATRSRAVMRMRANELGIEVVEWGDLISNRLVDRLRK